MKIFDRVFEFFLISLTWYDNWRHPKKFKVGDKVRDKEHTDLFQNLTIVEYDFYFEGRWWLYCEDNDPRYLSRMRKIPFREYQLELLPPEFLQYDPKQQGDTDEDI